MPLYSFINTETGEVTEQMVKIANYDQYLIDNPHLKRVPSAPGLVSSTGDRVKTDGGFQEVLSKIGEKHPYTPLGERYGPKDRKTVANRNILKKIRKEN